MKPVFTQPSLLCDFLIDGVCAHMLREGLVERRVEVGDVLHIGQLFHARTNNLQRGEIVSIFRLSAFESSQMHQLGTCRALQRRQIFHSPQIMVCFVADLRGIGVVASVYHSVTNVGEVVGAGDI